MSQGYKLHFSQYNNVTEARLERAYSGGDPERAPVSRGFGYLRTPGVIKIWDPIKVGFPGPHLRHDFGDPSACSVNLGIPQCNSIAVLI